MDPLLTDPEVLQAPLISIAVLQYAFFALVIAAMYTDVSSLIDTKEGRVPNWVTMPGIFGGMLLNALAVPSWYDGVSHSAKGFAVGFGLFLVLYAMGVFSAGDVKLMGAVGAMTGWYFTLNAILATTIIGGFVGVLQLGWRGLVQMSRDGGGPADAGGPTASSPASLGLEPRADRIPVHLVEAGVPAPSSLAPSTPAPSSPAPSSPATSSPGAAVRKDAPAHLPYGLCITLGCFVMFYKLKGNFFLPLAGRFGG